MRVRCVCVCEVCVCVCVCEVCVCGVRACVRCASVCACEVCGVCACVRCACVCEVCVLTCGCTVAPPSDATPRRMIGTQQQKSVRTMSVMRLAIVWSVFISADLSTSVRVVPEVCVRVRF